MIPFNEQIKLIIYYFILGMFISIILNLSRRLTDKIKSPFNYIIQILFWLIIIILTTLFIISNTAHYLGLYSIIFVIIGMIIYDFFLEKNLLHLSKNQEFITFMIKTKKIIKSILLGILIPFEIIKYLKKLICKLIIRKKKKAPL